MFSALLQSITNRITPDQALAQLTPASTGSIAVAPASPPVRHYRVAKLIMVTAANNNKFYEMRERDDQTFSVQFGRVGGTSSVATYPMRQWDKKFREKIAKGYVDQTYLFAEATTAVDASTIQDAAVRTFMGRLLELASQSIRQNYIVTAEQVTQKQVDSAQQLIDELTNQIKAGLTVDAFNAQLLDLFKIIPRRMQRVTEHLLQELPQSEDAIQQLRDRLASEQDTLDIMRSQVELNQPDDLSSARQPDLLASMNLAVAPVTDKRVLKLIKLMMGTDADKFEAAFQVSKHDTETAFNTFVANQTNQKTQLLWHGSRSENWISILKTGLVLRPANAIITGKMFGYGIYFADQFSKSLNYTSLHGSVWANGKQREGYLAIYEVHVGKQLEVDTHESWHYQLDASRLKTIDATYDSVFAQRGVSLLKNEFIVYNQAQCTIRYMVKINC